MLLTGTDTSLMPKYQRGWSIRTCFWIQMENITDLWVSDDNSHPIISSYNQYLPMPPFTEFYDLKAYSKKLFFCWPKRYSGEKWGWGWLPEPSSDFSLAGFLLLFNDHLRSHNSQNDYGCPIDTDVISPSALGAAQPTGISI